MKATDHHTETAAPDRSRPPKAGKPRRLIFPPFTINSLQNGIPVYTVENHSQPYVSLQLVLRTGSKNDGQHFGLTNFTSTLLLSGTTELDTQQFAEKIDYLGASLSAIAGRDEITIRLGVLRKFLPEALELMAQMVLQPTFPDEEVERERKQLIAELKQNRSDPEYLADAQFRHEIHAGTPYGHPVEGTETSLKAIAPEECRSFHADHFIAGNAFFVAAGDTTSGELVHMLEERFGSWSGTTSSSSVAASPKVPGRFEVVIVHRPGSVQSSICLGTPAVARRDSAFIPLVVLNTILGGYFNSRINNSLREVHGYTYGAHATLDAPVSPGSFSIATSVRTEVTAAALKEISAELHRITTEEVAADELEMVKNYIIGSQALQIETPGQVASFVRSIALYGLPIDYYRKFPARVRELTQHTLLSTAQQFLRSERMVAVVTGDANVIASSLEELGPVRIVDTRGKTISLSG